MELKTHHDDRESDDNHPGSETKNDNNQPGAPSPLAGRGLSDHDRRILEDSGRPAQEIETLDQMLRAGTVRQPNPTLNLSTLFARERDRVIAKCGGKSLMRARVFGTVMVRIGAYHPVRGWNAVGDHLGRRGHNLPTVKVGGVCYYDVAFLGADEEAKRDWEQRLRAMEPAALALLIAEISD